MADKDAYRKRSEELFSEHEEFRDDSLLITFPNFLLDFEGGYEHVLAGELSEEQLAMMGIVSDVKMSHEGLAALREAAANEADGWTADLREKEKVMEKLCSELETSDSVTLGRLLNKASRSRFDSRLQRYEKLLASLSPADRVALDAVFFEAEPGQLDHAPRRPVNADHIWDTLAMEFPERVLEETKRECERYELTKGKRFVQFEDRGPDQPFYDDSGNVTLLGITSTSGYRLVDE